MATSSGLPKIVILGAGFAGHAAALHLSELVKGRAAISVVAPRNRFTWFPSLIWVGTGTMSAEQTWFELAPVYERLGIEYLDARAEVIAPEDQTVGIRFADGRVETLAYEYLLNATGPYLNFEGTPGLGPTVGSTQSVCSVEHALGARDAYNAAIEQLRQGKRQRIVIGVGHPGATCEGAAFEYIMNVHWDLQRRGLRERAELVWLTNEPEAGDFGVDGIEAKKGGVVVTGAAMLRMLFDEARFKPIIAAGVSEIRGDSIQYDVVGGDPTSLDFDFAMLIPQFRGIPSGDSNEVRRRRWQRYQCEDDVTQRLHAGRCGVRPENV